MPTRGLTKPVASSQNNSISVAVKIKPFLVAARFPHTENPPANWTVSRSPGASRYRSPRETARFDTFRYAKTVKALLKNLSRGGGPEPMSGGHAPEKFAVKNLTHKKPDPRMASSRMPEATARHFSLLRLTVDANEHLFDRTRM